MVREALGLSLKQEADHEWLKREVTLGFAQLEAGETTTVLSRRAFKQLARAKS